MKNSKLVLFAVLVMLAALTGCGKSNNSSVGAISPYAGTAYPNGQYPVGTNGVGQLPMQMVGQGSDGYLAVQTSGSQVGIVGNIVNQCTPISAGITFSGAMYLDSANLIAGQGIQGNSSASGQLQLSQLYVQTIMTHYGQAFGGQIPCATVTGMVMTHYNTRLYGGYVMIMLNNNPQMTLPVYF